MNNRKISLLLIEGSIPPPWGGISATMRLLLPRLVNYGYKIADVVSIKHNPDVIERYLNQGIEVIFRRQVMWLDTFRFLFKEIKNLYNLKKSSKLDFKTFVDSMHTPGFWYLAAEKKLKREKVDIIHSFDYPWSQGLTAILLGKRFNAKVVLTTFGEVSPHQDELVHHDEKSRLMRPFVKWVLDRADKVTSLSHHCSKETEFVGFPSEKVDVLYWGIDVEEFKPSQDGTKLRKELGINDKLVILFQGQIRKRKGPQILLESATLILKEVPDTHFLFVGADFNLKDELEKKAQQIGISKNVTFLGPQSKEALPSIFNACDIFCFPTCTTIECQGLVQIQAMACSKPVIASRIAGIPEITIDNETGFLFEPGDSADLSKKAIILFKNPFLREKMGNAGRNRAVEHFSIDTMAKNFNTLYKNLLKTNE